ncbi:glutathione-dependent disulfide-bond oxidoreductase [Pseudomonas typographi]|uniref:Glutathione-dependent disulfide-bond oxidoreductase n=1 Tax=Pseudomonas typographi TaxID=2715964 RepID=A0ABR7Z7J9_9PSED|nr:glutathione-dependent disulfide-bond oxidoreductase [Pseudomonas typographi]MBD1554642.1 glutathione-dependent disulfide-bond oxidoreductase [Pseudomonas typographi]MBD1587153.1 glutathione-dependent disulfide-bond oxidoreductase [Pseudomonas typographi]MBD1601397.1 glutathione-dependent disulfide-bond oxidoreductase [Pseudomonas typographi]
MPDTYTPPAVWTPPQSTTGQFASINRPVAGATHDKALPVGEHPFQLYSLATPNGIKVTILFEELLERGHTGAEYDAWPVRINEGEQFGSGFVAINPNSKIPALVDRRGKEPVRVFESGAILLYLADAFADLLPQDPLARTEALNWLFWQMGAAPFLGGGFGHFYAYAPEKLQYPIDRYAMETKRQLDVLNRHLEARAYIAGAEYSIADIAIWSWYGKLVRGELYNAGEFLSVQDYTHVKRWADTIAQRPAVERGQRVNRTWGDEATQVPERHGPGDFA